VITFVVPGRPVPKARPRVTKRGAYTPQTTKDYEDSVAWAAKAAGVTLRSDNDVGLRMTFHIPVTKAGAPRKMDLDNLVKSVMDSLRQIAYVDDSQVSLIVAMRRDTGGTGTTTVTICDALASAAPPPDI